MGNIPKAIGPYSAYQRVGNLVITSGQLPINPATNKIDGETIYAQVLQSLANIEAILQKEGGTLADVMKMTVYLTDLSVFASVNEAFEAKLQAPYPARTAIQVSKLPLDGAVEIEAIASLK